MGPSELNKFHSSYSFFTSSTSLSSCNNLKLTNQKLATFEHSAPRSWKIVSSRSVHPPKAEGPPLIRFDSSSKKHSPPTFCLFFTTTKTDRQKSTHKSQAIMPPTLAESIKAITDSRPPVTDGITYLTILDMHLNAELLPHLNTILQDPELTQLIGWDLVDSLLSYGEKAEECLMTIAKLGNPREVILKIAEVIDRLDLKDDEEHVDGEEQEFVEGDENKGYGEVDEEGYDADEEISFDEQANRQENADDNEVLADKQGDEQKDEAHGVGASKQGTGNKVTNTRGEQADTDEVGETVEMLMRSKLTDEKELGDDKSETKYTPVDKFCLLVKLLPIVHSRIKTKYPSRFLQTSLDAIFNAYVPSAQATLAVVLFIKVISGHKRPVLPGRKSSLTIQDSTSLADSRSMSESTVPDPEAESEAHDEAKLQNYMLLEFTMMVLRDFVMVYDLEWADRLLEHYHPEQIVKGRLSTSTRYQEDPDLRERDIVVGQLLVSLNGKLPG